MDREQATKITKKYIESQFPKTCRCCGVVFSSLAHYIKNTTHHADPVSYDAEQGDYQPEQPIGTASYAVCRCGTTLAITSRDMPLKTMWRLLLWAGAECLRRGISMSELLRDMREDIDSMALNECENG